MKRKIILITGFFFLLRFFCIPEISFAVSVKDLYPAAKVWDAVAQTMSIPAEIEASGVGGVLDRVVTVVMDSATLGSLAGLALGIGSYYAAGAYIDWLMGTTSPPLSFNSSGNLVKHTFSVSVPACLSSLGYSLTSSPYYVGDFSSAQAASDAVRSACTAGVAAVTGGATYGVYRDTQNGCSVCSCTVSWRTSTYDVPSGVTTYQDHSNLYGSTVSANPGYDNHESPASPSDVASQLVAGLAAGTVNAIAAAKAVVDQTSSVYPSGAVVTPSLKGTPIVPQIKAYYDSKLNAADVALAQRDVDAQTAEQNATAAAAEAAAAVSSTGLTSILGSDVPVPNDIPIVIPDKKSLTGVIQTFIATINTLPIMRTLQGLTIQCGGTSSLCINLPNNLGGHQCFDVGPSAGSINMAGQALLGITTLFMFVWIFRG
jgi:hypothetical protein